MKKIIYIANIRLPTEKAHGLAVMRVCEAFAEQGLEVELVIPRRLNSLKQEPFEYYGVGKHFNIKKLLTIDLASFGKFGFLMQALSFSGFAFWYGLFKRVDIVYGRDELSLSYLSFFRKNVVWEAHTAKKSWFVKVLLKRCKKLVVISLGLKDYYVSLGTLPDKILVAPSGVDLNIFESVKESKEELRSKLRLPLDKKIVAYVGKLHSMGMDKGVEELEMVFGSLSRENPDIYPLIVSDVPLQEVPLYMKAASLLVMNYPNTEHYAKYMSPLKLFEYMASGTPMVVPDLPSIKEVLGDSMAHFFKPNDSNSLKMAISKALTSSEADKDNIEKVKEYSWSERSKKIIQFIK